MTKAQARQRVWSQVRAGLELAIKGRATWLEQSREHNPLSKKDQERMTEAAEEILGELREFESRL
jgi:hypothetical protein